MSEIFDTYSKSYEDTVQDSIAFSGLSHDLFIEAKINIISGLFKERFGNDRPTLLDVGCGIGRMHARLMPLVAGLAGTDTSRESINRAQRENPRVVYRLTDRDKLPWPNESFNATIAVCVLHHVPSAQREAFLAEMRRVTSPGGLVTLIEHNPWNPLTRLAVARCPFDRDAALLNARRARSLMRRVLLTKVESRYFLLLPTAASWARPVERTLRRVPLGAQYIAVGEV